MDLTIEAPESRMGRREFIGLISMLMALTALAIDMMLPAFGEMRRAFGLEADSSDLALVVTVFLVGFGLGQPVWGLLSDALGRKRILWIGLSIYAIAALGAAFSTSFGLLLVWRLASGLGAAAVRVATLGSVRDRHRGEQMARVMSYVMGIFILVPVVAPSIGAIVLALGTWRWVFAFIGLAALLTGLWALRLPESLPPGRRMPLDPRRLMVAARAVVTSRFAMGFTIAQAAAFGFLSSYLGSSELIVRDVFGLQDWFPLIFAGTALMSGAAFVLNPRLLDRFGLRRTIVYASIAFLGSTLLFAAIAVVTGGRPPFGFYLAGILPIMAAYSFVIPNVNSAAMWPMERIAGTAAAIIGSISILGGAVVGAIVDAAFDGSVTPFAIAATVVASLALLACRWSDGVWERSAERELLAPDEQTQATSAASVEIG